MKKCVSSPFFVTLSAHQKEGTRYPCTVLIVVLSFHHYIILLKWVVIPRLQSTRSDFMYIELTKNDYVLASVFKKKIIQTGFFYIKNVV